MKRRDNNYSQAIDREKTCPFLLRMFCKENQRHMLEDFIDSKVPEKDELQIYTWPDATLRELSDCVQRELEISRKKDAELSFSFIYPDNNGKYRRKDVGTVIIGQRGPDDLKSLNQLRFVIGDYIDLAIYNRKEREDNKYEARRRGDSRDQQQNTRIEKKSSMSEVKQESVDKYDSKKDDRGQRIQRSRSRERGRGDRDRPYQGRDNREKFRDNRDNNRDYQRRDRR